MGTWSAKRGRINLSSFTCNISNVASYYFITNPSVSLVSFTGRYATLNDGEKNKKILIGAVGTGETYLDVIAGWDLTSGWATYGAASITDLNTLTGAASGGVLKSGLVTVGELYKLTFERTTTAAVAAFNLRKSDATGLGTSLSTGSSYKTSITDYTYLGVGNSSAGTTDITSMKAEKVLTPSSTGIWFTPVSEDSEWNPNAAAYTVTIN